jgi:hypothetical protein
MDKPGGVDFGLRLVASNIWKLKEASPNYTLFLAHEWLKFTKQNSTYNAFFMLAR